MSRGILFGALAACAAPQSIPVGEPAPEVPPAIFKITDHGVGPIDASTRATLTAVRELVGPLGFAVRPINDGGVELHVYDANEHLLYVIPNDDGSLFNVHVVSSSVPITQHPEWVIGKPFVHSERLTDCEPWGEHPMCWRAGDHVAVGFEVDTEGLDTREGRRSLEQTSIQRAVWSAKPFGDEDDTEPRVPAWVPQLWNDR